MFNVVNSLNNNVDSIINMLEFVLIRLQRSNECNFIILSLEYTNTISAKALYRGDIYA